MLTPATDLKSDYIGNFREVDPGKLYAGAQPTIPDGIKVLRDTYGVNTVIDLQSADVEKEAAACLAVGLAFISIPLPGIEICTEPPRNLMDTIRRTIQEQVNQPVFVHCLHGADRTGAVVGEYRIDHGATAEEAIAEMRKYHNSWIELGYRRAVTEYYERLHGERS